ncbi:hypothetical protein [Anabaena azotica]|uniref:Uncharacterized protein n=1 Tax=Anabaena azotica FACHB-119 TaxID=947527 RepID=A0ABR8DCH0_9NOST|nr:hypothetical protein [Anabaena azotica]MBD2504925.1 hypothetical protein [Anabaena azotica FACHB-119]
MAKASNRLPCEASPVKKPIISKFITWATTPKGMSTLLGKMASKIAIASAISLIIAQGSVGNVHSLQS